jgi:hypothetical protein
MTLVNKEKQAEIRGKRHWKKGHSLAGFQPGVDSS